MSRVSLSFDPHTDAGSDGGGDMSSDKVLFGLVTPVRDAEAFIGAIIESVAAQTIRPLRWIIVDDGSRDRSAEFDADLVFPPDHFARILEECRTNPKLG